MRMICVAVVASLAAASNYSQSVDATPCHVDDCFKRCEQVFGGSRRRSNGDSYATQRCYCSKACATMDCSSGYKVVDHDAMCKSQPMKRHSQCQQNCKKAATKGAWVDFCNQGCDFWCDASSVKGRWEYQWTLATQTTRELDHGTHKSWSESRTEEWSQSVTTKVSEGLKFERSSVSVTIAHSVSKTYSHEWSVSDTEKFTVKFPQSDVGKAVWQFVFDTKDSCSHSETTFSKEYAVTKNANQKPCCLPGYGKDAPAYQTCLSGSPNVCKSEAVV